jgi:hypothetical protein
MAKTAGPGTIAKIIMAPNKANKLSIDIGTLLKT